MSRLFTALDLPAEIKHQLLQLSRAYAGAAWQTAAQMHITLVFIGELDKSQLPELLETLNQIPFEPLNLCLKGVDFFGSARYPRILYASVEKNPPLEKLQKQIYKAVTAMGIEVERKKYIPHITLARLDRTPYENVGQFLEAEALFKTNSFMVEQFHLYSSKPTRAGSEYRIEASFPLLSVSD